MNATAKDLIYLLACAVNGIVPDSARVQAMDIEKLYQFCKWHTLRGAAYAALKRAGVNSKPFQQAYYNAVRKIVMLDAEREAILAEFERRGIWYMPLKGTILKELYPETGMREMADNDILYDAEKQDEVQEIMLGRGYTAEIVGKSDQDVYTKPPVLNFELHTLLFRTTNEFYPYYQNPKRLMIKDTGCNYGFHLSDEDFYVYVLAHEYKHFSRGGTGLRSLLDCYVYIREKGDTLDWAYIQKEAEQLGIADYEQNRRALARRIFSSDQLPELTAAEAELLESYLNYGTYGTISHSAENIVRNVRERYKSKSKIGYLRRRLFPDPEYMKLYFPFFYRHKLLLPVGYLWRMIRAPFCRGSQLLAELKVLRKHDHKSFQDR